MELEIVKFKNGMYGIRKRTWIDVLFGREGSFRDFKPSPYTTWRKQSDRYFDDCQLATKEAANDWLLRISGKYVEEEAI